MSEAPQLNSVASVDSSQAMPWHQMITRIPEDYYSFFKTSFTSRSLPVLAGIAALTGVLMVVDEPLGSWSHSLVHRSANYSGFSRVMVETGDGRYHFIFSGALAIYGISAGDSRALKTASNLAEGIIASGILVQLLKRLTGRQSPEASQNDSGEWRLLPNPSKYQKNQPKYYAFPSGHITTASLTVTVLANSYPEIKWIRPVGYALVGGLGLGLMSRGMHWVSDLPLGILLGYAFGNIVAPEKAIAGSSQKDPSKGGLSVIPLYSPSSYSLALIYSF
ncbi:MAG: phosphatase PAP2 family protein [Syntrophomonadaceae bacterium]